MKTRKLKIAITAAEEPLVVNGFIRDIIKFKSSQIIGIGIVKSKGAIPKISKGRSTRIFRNLKILIKARNLLSLFLIFGIIETIRNTIRILYFHFSKIINCFLPFYPTSSIKHTAKKYQISYKEFLTVHDPQLIEYLTSLKPDIIINQAPGILTQDYLKTASIGVLNRHNSLLPKNRGRFAPFWAIYNQEEYAGVSIHFVVKKLDAGDIIIQKKIKISELETVASLVRKCYSQSPYAMIQAIEKLESSDYELLPNSDENATYNTNPTLEEIFKLWRRRFKPERLFSLVSKIRPLKQ